MLQSAWRVASKDLRIELRTGEIVLTTGLFALLVTVIASLSFYIDPTTARRVAPGVLWIAIAFSGVLAMARSWAREREQDAFRALLLAPIPRASIYLGKLVGIIAFLAAVEIPLTVLVAVLFHVDLIPIAGPLVVLLATGTIGFASAGTLFAAMGVRTRARDLMLSVVLFPLIAPTLLAGVVATREVLGGASLNDVMPWVRMMIASDVLFIAAGIWLFEPLLSE